MMRNAYVARARYGTGDFLKLNKRSCETRIRLTPCGTDFQKVQMRINGTNHEFFLSSIMGSQLSSFLSAVYCLNNEEDHEHGYFYRYWKALKREYPFNRTDGNYSTSVDLHWDGEMYGYASITLSRTSPSDKPRPLDEADPITIVIRRRKCQKYIVDGHDLCYALAKAYTEALKKYGFKGFQKSAANQYAGDSVDMEEFLFVKAYALGVLGARETKTAWQNPTGWEEAFSSSFEKEIELLLFDM